MIDAALEAARIRLRPILMTSFSFIFGVLPLAISTGAGANSRIAIGTSVIGGMLTATLLAIFYIPLFFVLVRRGVRDGLAAASRALPRVAPERRNGMRRATATHRLVSLTRLLDGPPITRGPLAGAAVLAGRRRLSAAERGGASRAIPIATCSAIRGCRR